MHLTHLGHACLLVEMADARLLIDPGNLSSDWHDVADLDAIVVTHQHPDHLDIEVLPGLISANPSAPLIVDPGTRELLAAKGIEAYEHGGEVASIGAVRLSPVGQTHALIHADIPRIPNLGIRCEADGEPSLYVTGDALDGEPGQVDVVAFPLTAPWQASKEMVTFLRRMNAPVAVPVHDAVASPAGRGIYLSQATNLSPGDTHVRDIAGAGPQVFST